VPGVPKALPLIVIVVPMVPWSGDSWII
jgi:hypothetical protein